MKRFIGLFLRESVILAFNKTVFKGLTFVFFLVVAARMTQEQFGDFQLIATLLNFLAQPLIAVPIVLTRIASTFPSASSSGNLRWLFDSARPWVLWATLAVVLSGAALDPWVASLFDLGGQGFFALTSLAAAGYLLFIFAVGFLQANEDFRKIGYLFLLAGLLTAGFGVLARFTTSIVAFYMVQPAALISVGVVACLGIARGLATKPLPFDKKELLRLWPGLASVVVAVAAFFVIQTMDMITVKLLFDRTTAGMYARLELLGKLSFTLASSIALVLLPRAGRAFERGSQARSVLARGTRLYFGAAGIALVALWASSDFLLNALYGRPLEGATVILVVVSAAKIVQSYLFVMINYRGAVLDRDCAWIMTAAATVQLILMVVNHGSLMAVAVNLLLTSVATAAVLGWMPVPQARIQADPDRTPGHKEVPA